MSKFKVLVVFEVIPEETSFYKIEMTEEEYSLYSQANNYFINVDAYDENKVGIVNLFQSAISSNKDHMQYCQTEQELEVFGKWSSFMVDSISDLSDVDKGISLGFYL